MRVPHPFPVLERVGHHDSQPLEILTFNYFQNSVRREARPFADVTNYSRVPRPFDFAQGRLFAAFEGRGLYAAHPPALCD
jgi:hypothetical protein